MSTLSLLVAVSVHASLTASDAIAHTKQSVVHLEVTSGPRSTGTGWVVDASGRVVTNLHVIDEAGAMTAIFANGERKKVVGVLARGDVKTNDLAVIQLEPGNYQPLELETGVVSEGDTVFVVGGPHGLAFTATQGMVSSIRPQGVPQRLDEMEQFYSGPVIQLSVAIAPGSSGSPVVAESGRVIGVVASGYRQGDFFFAVPAASVGSMVKGLAPDAAVEAFVSSEKKNLIISGIAFGGAALALVVARVRRHRGPR